MTDLPAPPTDMRGLRGAAYESAKRKALREGGAPSVVGAQPQNESVRGLSEAEYQAAKRRAIGGYRPWGSN